MSDKQVVLSPSVLYLLTILHQCEATHGVPVTPSAVLMALRLWRKEHPRMIDPLLRLTKEDGAQAALNLLMAKLISEELVVRAEPLRRVTSKGSALVQAEALNAEQMAIIAEVARCRQIELKHTSTDAPSHSRPQTRGGTA